MYIGLRGRFPSSLSTHYTEHLVSLIEDRVVSGRFNDYQIIFEKDIDSVFISVFGASSVVESAALFALFWDFNSHQPVTDCQSYHENHDDFFTDAHWKLFNMRP